MLRFLFIILLLAACSARAQNGFRMGLLASGHMSKLGGYDAGDDTEERLGLGYGYGLTARYGFTPQWSVRLDIRRERHQPRIWGNFRDEFNQDVFDGYLHHRIERLTVPVLAQWQPSSSPIYFAAGLTVSYVISQRDIFLYDKSQRKQSSDHRLLVFDDFTSRVRRLAPGGQFGLGATFALGPRGELFIEATTAAIAMQGFRAGFRVLDMSTNPVRPFAPATPQPGWQKTVALTAGLRFGSAAVEE